MRARILAVVVTLLVVAGAVVVAVVLTGGEESGADVAGAVEGQLSYLEPDSSLVTTVDMRFEEENWGHLRTLATRVLREVRAEADLEERAQIPANATGGLELAARFAGLSFEDDVRPVLDGYLVAGVTVPPRRPIPPRLERLGELLEGAVFDPRRQAYVRVPQDRAFARRAERAPLVRQADGSRVTQQDAQVYFEAQQRREEAGEPRVVATYRTRRGGLRRVVEKVMEGDRPRAIPGYEDALLVESSIALVGDDTLVFAEGGPEEDEDASEEDGGGADRPSASLREALDRGRDRAGYPAGRLAAAQRELDADDPLVLAAGDATLARTASDVGLAGELFDEGDLDRARREVPYLAAVRGVSALLDLDEARLTSRLRVDTDANRLEDADLPFPPAGTLELPETQLVGSASRDQSVTTSFAAGVARALLAESDFVRSVERTERQLGMGFEEEVLRQFNCPSISVFDADRRRFAARSCLRDPQRMRELLPRLRPHLPRIVRALQNLGDGGMLGLLLVAPDAPATPSLQLAQLDERRLRPRGQGAEREQLYELGGLRGNVRSGLAQAGPERVVFGMIGDRFVVASDSELARRVATLPTRPHRERAATAIRVPAEQLVAQSGDSTETRVVERLVDELVVSASGDRSAFSARGELIFDR